MWRLLYVAGGRCHHLVHLLRGWIDGQRRQDWMRKDFIKRKHERIYFNNYCVDLCGSKHFAFECRGSVIFFEQFPQKRVKN